MYKDVWSDLQIFFRSPNNQIDHNKVRPTVRRSDSGDGDKKRLKREDGAVR